ncbi:MAG: phosphotransferase [Hyphomicrobiales bacterium]|nr:phosphotransferase [Hyphomicrobiales bacterium]
MNKLPVHPENFNTNFISEKLGFLPNTLKDFSFQAVGSGQVGDSYRLFLDWNNNEGPETIIAKCSAKDLTSRQTAKNMNLYEIEAYWYNQYGNKIPIRCPEAYFVGLDKKDIGNFIMFMEDLSPARQISQMAGCNVNDIRLALDEVALLHKAHWDDNNLSKIKCLNYGKDRKKFIKQFLIEIYPDWCSRYKDRIDKSILEMGKSLIDRYDSYIEIKTEPIVLSHGDFRLDNMLFYDNNGRVAVLDWQTLSAGVPMADIAYCISTSFSDSNDRKIHEETLISRYLKKLNLDDGVYPYELAWRDYRRCSFIGFLMGVISSMLVERTERGDEMFAVMVERSGKQAIQLESLSLI